MAGIKLSTLVRRLRREGPSGDGTDADLLTRFSRGRDDSAFELLVWRHGAMVLGACRRVLGHTEDAEDAFQATFLVLARKAGSVLGGASLPAWLHRVALRIASRLAKSRRTILPLTVDPPGSMVVAPVERTEELAALDEEIDRLPDRCRRAVVLCYLEGQTATEAGRQLGCPTGTVESRLAAARKLLRDRLTRRGVTLPVGVLAVVGGQGALAPEAVARVVRAAAAFAREGAATAGVVGQSSVKLAQGVLTMGRTRWWTGAMVVATAVAISTGVVWANREGAASPPDGPTGQPAVTIAPPPEAKAEPLAGQPSPAEAWPLAWQYRRDELQTDVGSFKGISPNGRLLYFHNGKSVVTIDITTNNKATVIDLASESMIEDPTFSPDGKFVATAEGPNGVKLRDATSWKVLDAFWPSGGIPPRQLAFTSDNTKLVALCWRNEFPDPEQIRSVDSLEVKAQKMTLAYQVCVWDMATRKQVGWPVGSVSGLTRPIASNQDSTRLDRSHRTASLRVALAARGRFVLKTEEIVKDVDGKAEIDGYRMSIIDPLTGASTKPALLGFPGFTPAAADGAISPDGKLMLAAKSHELLVYDATTGQERLRLGRSPQTINATSLFADPRFAGWTQTKRPLPIQAVSFSPDGKQIAAATGFGPPSHVGEDPFAPSEVIVWDVATGKELAALTDKESNRDYRSIRFSPDGSYLLTQDKRVSWNRDTTITLWGRPPQAGGGLPGREHPAGATNPPALKLGPIVTKLPPSKPLPAPTPPAEVWRRVRQVREIGDVKGVAPDGRSLIYQSGQSVHLYDLTTNQRMGAIHSSNPIIDTAFSSDGQFVATAEMANGVKLRDTTTGNILGAFWPGSGLQPHQLIFTQDNSGIIALCWRHLPGLEGTVSDKTVLFHVSAWDLATQKEASRPIQFVSNNGLLPAHVKFVAGGRFIVITEKTWNGARISVINSLTGIVSKPLELVNPGTISPDPATIELSPDGKAMTVVKAGDLLVFDTATGQERLRLGPLPQAIQAVAFSPDGKRIVAASGLGKSVVPGEINRPDKDQTGPTEIVMWDAATGKELARLDDKERNRDYGSIRFSPDGFYVIAQERVSPFETTLWGQPPQADPNPPATPGQLDAGSAGGRNPKRGPEFPQALAPSATPDRFQSLIRDLSAEGVADSRRVEAIFVAALGRFPTEIEARTLAAQITTQADKAVALRGLLTTLVDTAEFQAHAAAIQQLAKPKPPAGVSPPDKAPRFGPGFGPGTPGFRPGRPGGPPTGPGGTGRGGPIQKQ